MPTPATYLKTLLTLLALSFLTFGLSFVRMGAWSVVVAMSIAFAKASIVAVVFMHLRQHGASDRAAILLGLTLALLLITFAALDVATRGIS